VDPFGAEFSGNADAQAALAALRSTLQQRHGGSIESLLFYGSCLRSGDLFDGLVDLYALVRDYRSAHHGTLAALANRLLAPNVYYLQVEAAGRMVRCKYAVVSSAQLARAVSGAHFESYFWGRFCQPVAVAWAADAAAHARASGILQEATRTFLCRALPAVEARGSLAELWEHGLALSYKTELRAEGSGRAAELVRQGAAYFRASTLAVAPSLPCVLTVDGDQYSAIVDAGTRRSAAIAWRLRRVQGKLLSVLRLLKAFFTFEGGLDYIAWKLERHSGQRVEIPDRVRRYPLLFIWGLMLELYRRGVFR
jgi:hypothetical protein